MSAMNTCLRLLLIGSLSISACAKDPEKTPALADSAVPADKADVNANGGPLDLALASEAGLASEAATEAAIPSCISNADDLIADFSADNGLAPIDGREGGFYVYGDESIKGKFEPPVLKCEPYPIEKTTGNPYCSGGGSLHVKASGWGVWGAALGTDLMPKIRMDSGVGDCGEGFKGTYDASKYRGVSFWAKASAPLKGVQVSFPDAYSDAGATFKGLPDATDDPNFNSCVYISDPKYNCSPYLVKFGADPIYFPAYREYQIDTTWKRFDVYFADTRQDQYNRGFHSAASPDQSRLDVKHLTAMAIQVNALWVAGAPTPNDFELWIDDVYFIR